MKSTPILLILTVFLLAIAGCAQKQVSPKEINYGLSSFFQPEKINQIAIMPLGSSKEASKVAQRVRDELTVQILKLDRFEIIDRFKVDQLLEEEGIESNELTTDLAKKLGSKLQANAVLVGEITEYRPSLPGPIPVPMLNKIMAQPPAVGIYLRMVSVDTGTVLWNVNDRFDASDASFRSLTKKSGDQLSDETALIVAACTEIAKTLNF